MDVTVDHTKLAAHGLTVTQVAAALQQASIVQSVGSLKQGSATIPLQVSGSLTSLDQIGKVTVTPPLGTPSGGKPAAPVSINQQGTLQVAAVPADTITRTNGKPSIGLQIVKGPNTNTVTVANEVWNALPGIESSIGLGVRMDSIQDQSTPITQAIANILREGLLGAVFAVLVIFVLEMPAGLRHLRRRRGGLAGLGLVIPPLVHVFFVFHATLLLRPSPERLQSGMRAVRSGYVAAKRIAIGPPSEKPITAARREPAASITAREYDQPGERRDPLVELGRRALPGHFKVREHPAAYEDDIEEAVSDDAIRDVDVPALRVSDLGRSHGPIVSHPTAPIDI